MTSRTTVRFRRLYESLPKNVRRQADKAFRLWLQNPSHPSLEYKRLHSKRPVYSARVSRDWRALAVVEGEDTLWFWIGSHSDYDDLISRL